MSRQTMLCIVADQPKFRPSRATFKRLLDFLEVSRLATAKVVFNDDRRKIDKPLQPAEACG